MSLCFISMQRIAISTHGSCNHTPYLAEWKMRIFLKCVHKVLGRGCYFIITCTILNTLYVNGGSIAIWYFAGFTTLASVWCIIILKLISTILVHPLCVRGGSTNSVDRGQREQGSGCGSFLVRGCAKFANGWNPYSY
jgi:hypothetical protein